MKNLRNALTALTLTFAALGHANAEDVKITDKWSFANANPAFLPGIAFQWVGDYPALNFYKQEGIDVSWHGSQGATACIQFLLRKQVDSCVLAQDQVLLQAAQGNRLPLTFAYDYTYKITNQFAVKPNSPIKTIADLKGKKIGITSLAHDTYTFGKLVFKGLGIDENNVQFLVAGNGGQAAELLYSGQVDALLYYDIVWALFDTLKKPVRVLPQPDFVDEVKAGPVVVIRTEDIEKRPETVKHFFRAFVKSTLFTIENPEAAMHIHFAMHPETLLTGVSYKESYERSLPQMKARLPALEKDLGGVQYYGEFNPNGWIAYVKNILGLDPTKVNPADFYTNAFAKDYNDFDEGAFRKWSREYKFEKQ
jgi:NitT/TauT family transport system substrate-binding protein